MGKRLYLLPKDKFFYIFRKLFGFTFIELFLVIVVFTEYYQAFN